MNGQLTNAQGELLIYIPIVEESIRKGEIDMDFDEAIDALIEGSSLFDFDTLRELKNMDYIDDETQLTQKGKVFVEEQLEKERKELQEQLEKERKELQEQLEKDKEKAVHASMEKKRKRLEVITQILTAIASGAAEGATSAIITAITGGNK